MTGIVIRLAGVEQPETRVFHQKAITIGTAPSCDLSFREEHFLLPPSAILLHLTAEEGPYRVTEMHEEAQLIRDGESVVLGEAIRDGDTISFGTSGVRLRFFSLSPSFELAESLHLGAAVLSRSRTEAKTLPASQPAAPRTDVAIVFVKQLLRELVAEIPRRYLVIGLSLVALAVGAWIYMNVLNFIATRINTDRTANLNKDVNDLKEKLAQMGADIKTVKETADEARKQIALPMDVVGQYGAGVCLVYGLYTYIDPRSGREARYKDGGDRNNLLGPNGAVNISVDGVGPPSDIEFIGTGFQVAAGMVLTNRHVVQPWDDDPVTGILRNHGLRARLKELYVYFPKVNQPFALHTLETSLTDDVALGSFQRGDTDPKLLPILPLDDSQDSSAVSGQPMVLMGYPAGLDGLMAKVDDKERSGLSLNRRTSLKAVLNELATRGLIRPLTTQGHVSDLLTRKIVHDAATTDGGSGGPIFGANGKVIGINQAVLDNSPAKFGVPIRYGLELLQKQKPEAVASQAAGADGSKQ